MNWEMMGQVVSVAGLCATAFHFAVLKPLNEAILRLDDTLRRMDNQLQKIEDAHHLLDLKVAEIDQRSKSAHARLDELMKMVRFEYAEK